MGVRQLLELTGEAKVGGRSAVLPRLTGQATIYGTEELSWDPQDPFFKGFALSDTRGPQVDSLG